MPKKEPVYCAFCDNEAVAVIKRSKAPLCRACLEVYEAGQSNPRGEVKYID
jgi:phosphoribosylamine-glycine ligase